MADENLFDKYSDIVNNPALRSDLSELNRCGTWDNVIDAVRAGYDVSRNTLFEVAQQDN